jgi:hypothetical protein
VRKHKLFLFVSPGKTDFAIPFCILDARDKKIYAVAYIAVAERHRQIEESDHGQR